MQLRKSILMALISLMIMAIVPGVSPVLAETKSVNQNHSVVKEVSNRLLVAERAQSGSQEEEYNFSKRHPIVGTLMIVGLIGGLIIGAVGYIMLLLAAFRTGIGWGCAVLFVPIAGLFFVCVNWQSARIAVLTLLAAILIIGASVGGACLVEIFIDHRTIDSSPKKP